MENKTKIILIEDDEFVRKMYEIGLGNAGFEVISAINGEDGLKLIQEVPSDLVFLDIIMPKFNGFEVLKKLNELDIIKNLKVVMLTNLEQESDLSKALELGAKDYIVKSDSTIKEIVKKIKKILNQ